MTTKTKATKAVSSLDAINEGLRQDFESIVNLDAELKVFERAVSMLNAGSISVRGLKATIEKAQEKGALPTIKPSTAQYFANASKVRSLKGGDNKALKDVLNVTIQGKRAFGKEFSEKLESAESFAQFANSIPSQGERAKAGRKSAKPEAVTADAVISLALGLWKDLDKHEINDMAQAEKFAEMLARAISFNKRKHPSQRVA